MRSGSPCSGRRQIRWERFDEHEHDPDANGHRGNCCHHAAGDRGAPLKKESLYLKYLREFELAFFKEHLEKAQGSLTKLSAQIGLSRNTVIKKIRKLDLQPRQFNARSQARKGIGGL